MDHVPPPPPPVRHDQEKLQGLSLKTKLLLILLFLPTLSLSVYIVLAISKFEDDKKSYVQGGSLSHTHTVSSQLRSNIENTRANLRPIVEGWSSTSNSLDATGSNVFQKDPKLLYTGFYSFDGSGRFTLVHSLFKPAASDDQKAGWKLQAAEIAQRSLAEALTFEIERNGEGMFVAERFQFAGNGKPVVVVGLTPSPEVLHIVQKKSFYATFVLRPDGRVLMEPSNRLSLDFTKWGFFHDLTKHSRHEGVRETTLPDGREVIVSFSKTGVGESIVISVVERSAAFAAVEELLKESLAFFVALLSLMAIAAVLAARKLTSSLRSLAHATQRVAQGDFDIDVDVQSKDEVGQLAVGFNRMAGEVKRLMAETADKARMEKELETAKTVQETLFPAATYQSGLMQIAGFYEPASECGGDWWHYCEIGNKLYVWIGDATGHGAPAALVTSAAKSAASVIERLGPLSPGQAMELMNKAIHETSKGRILMTFFLAAIDKSTGKMIYSNASHDPPFLIKKSAEPLKKKDLVLLNEVNNPRLGQDGKTKFSESSLQLQPGDTLLLYTDGIADIRSPSHESWGERQFLKSALKAATLSSTAEAMELLKNDAQEYRQATPLEDDITFFFCRYEKAA